MITVLYVRSSELIHLITESLYHLTNMYHIPPSSSPANHHSTLGIQLLFFTVSFHI